MQYPLCVNYGARLTARQLEEFEMLHDDAQMNRVELARWYRVGQKYAQSIIKKLPGRNSIKGTANPSHPLYRGPAPDLTPIAEIEIEKVEEWLTDRGIEVRDVLLVGDGVALVFGTMKAANLFIESLRLLNDEDPASPFQQLVRGLRCTTRLVSAAKVSNSLVTSGRWRHTVVLPGNLVTSLGLVTSGT